MKAILNMMGRQKAEMLLPLLPSMGLTGLLPPVAESGPIGGWIHIEGTPEAIQAAAKKCGSHLHELLTWEER